MSVLWFNKTIKEAIEEPRFHHQLFPMELQYEKGTPSVSNFYNLFLSCK